MDHFRIELECGSHAAARRAFRAFAEIGAASAGPSTTTWPGQAPETDSKVVTFLEAEDQAAAEAKLVGLVGDGPKIVDIYRVGDRPDFDPRSVHDH
jgi:hypothetical protein